MTEPEQRIELLENLRQAVGARHVITGSRATGRFSRGYRSGQGEALAVVRPASLIEQWQVLEICVAADVIVIMQAANTGLTEGSTPKGLYDREVVIVSTLRMTQIHLIDDGRQIVAFPGASLFALERMLEPLGREPHSVIGSSCIGASIVGGVCNNSGGALVARGPSYTEFSLHARIGEQGRLELVNHLGIDLGHSPEEILTRLERQDYGSIRQDSDRKASDTDYAQRVRAVDESTPARFNADASRLCEASGCAGKLAVFAVRLDTYPRPVRKQVFYIGTNDSSALTRLRRDVLTSFEHLPVSGEYMHRHCHDIARRYGKDMLVLIDLLGTASLPRIFALKRQIDEYARRLPGIPSSLTDLVMQGLFLLWPPVLPGRMNRFRKRFDHHLILTMADQGIDEAERYLSAIFGRSGHERAEDGDYFACTRREGHVAGLHRYVAAGAAIRYCAVHRSQVENVLALDIALRRNDHQWFETLPPEIDRKLVHKLYYGHFFCHVLHQDYIVRKGEDVEAIKTALLDLLDQRGAQYPAEHNVGHMYVASESLCQHYRRCDPTNQLNPGIGGMPRRKHYR